MNSALGTDQKKKGLKRKTSKRGRDPNEIRVLVDFTFSRDLKYQIL